MEPVVFLRSHGVSLHPIDIFNVIREWKLSGDFRPQ